MDPETAKVWAPVVAAFVGGLLGALSALAVTVANARNQRRMAIDTARREWRAEQIRPLLETVEAQARAYVELSDALAHHNTAEAERLARQLSGTPKWAMEATRVGGAMSDRMIKALELLQSVEKDLDEFVALRRVMTEEDMPRALELSGRLAQAHGAIHQAAEDLLFPDPPPSWWHRVRSRRPRRK